MEIQARDVKTLRDATGAGMMECKKALQEAGGDAEKAKMILRERGLASAKKLASRAANEGLIEVYLHRPDPDLPPRIGVLIEVNCATDFVAKTPRVRELAREIAMHIAAAQPAYVSREDVPAEVVEREREIYAKQAEGKPANVVERIVEGKMKDFFSQVVLVDQPYIRDDKRKIGDLLDEATAELKEPVRIRRFVAFRVGAE